ncbi:MAG: hypothetical protein NTU53_03285 [Planctomycetota bacterium]|nr:hypothetical protein [Planctomycetota bacterium]
MANNRLTVVCVGLMLSWMIGGWQGVACANALPDNFVGTWCVTVTPDSNTEHDGGKEFGDALVFDAGELLTENFAYLGFDPGAYTVPEAEPYTVSATMTSGCKGTLAWSGTISSGTMTGQLVWTKPSGVIWRFSFRGTK